MHDPSDDDLSGLPPLLAAFPFPQASSSVQVEFGAHSRRGRSRLVNEDHYMILRLGRFQETIRSSVSTASVMKAFEEDGYAMVVADGTGGSGAGEAASRLAIVALVHLVRVFGKWNLRIDDLTAREIMDRAERFYRHIDSAMIDERAPGHRPGMQTTLTATFGAGRDLFFAHVGHSRAYLFRDGRLMRLTRDHTIGGSESTTTTPVAPLVDVSATARDLQHILTNTLGMGGSAGPRIDLERFQLADRDKVLVCTNGLTDALDERAIAEGLASDRLPDETCRTLVDLAGSSEGSDDTTALLARYRIPE